MASQLLKQAGYQVKDKSLVDSGGAPLEIEFLLFEASFKRIIGPYIQNLKRLGITPTIRIVDVSNFKRRQDSFDFDIVIRRISQPLTPGLEQRNYFGSEFANVPGSFNIGGVADPAIDALIEKVTGATSRPALTTAVRALDRVVMWNRYVVTQWYKGAHNVAYWNKFNRPAISPTYDMGVLDTWWYDPAKARMIKAGKAPPPPPGAFIGILFTGAMLIEIIFSLDGLGLLGFEAAIKRDYPIMFATVYFFTLLGLVMNLVGDLMYTIIDPRIDFEGRHV